MKSLTELKLEVARLENELTVARTNLYNAKVASLPWKIGDIVRGKAGKEAKIVGVADAEWGWPRVVYRRTNGEWSRQERTIYS